MTHNITKWTDDQLRDYLAGTLTDAKAREFELAVENNPDLERRLIAMDPLGPCIKNAFLVMPGINPELSQDVLAQVQEATAPNAQNRLTPILAAVAGLVIGVIGVSIFSQNKELVLGTWQDQVAAYQVLYVPETIASLIATASELDTQFDRAGLAIGLDLNRSALDAFDALTLRRAQILGLEGEPLVQIVLSTAENVPIAFCIVQSRTAATALQSTQTMLGLESITWSSGEGHEFLLIGGKDSQVIEELAAQLQSIFASAQG